MINSAVVGGGDRRVGGDVVAAVDSFKVDVQQQLCGVITCSRRGN